jgi:DnaJ-class molecular chaperone
MKDCDECRGHGSLPFTGQTCPECVGLGRVGVYAKPRPDLVEIPMCAPADAFEGNDGN